jgi:hypothetical protein
MRAMNQKTFTRWRRFDGKSDRGWRRSVGTNTPFGLLG